MPGLLPVTPLIRLYLGAEDLDLCRIAKHGRRLPGQTNADQDLICTQPWITAVRSVSSGVGHSARLKKNRLIYQLAFGSVRAGRKERAQLIRAQRGRLRLLWRDPTGAVSKFPLFLLEYFD